MNPALPSDDRYRLFVAELKERVLAARTSAARAVNRDLVLLYWDLGRAIVEQHGGRIWVERAGTGGSRFAFVLPRADRPGADNAADAA